MSIYGKEFGDGGMNDPDWDRVLVQKGKISPLGDPTRWGAIVQLAVSSIAEVSFASSAQVIQAQCGDGYSRAWSIVGTVTADAALWAYPDSVGVFTNGFLPALEVTMGVGQAHLIHNFRLRPIIDADAPFYVQGQGGGGVFIGDATRLTKPFLIPGALVANAISMRVEHAWTNIAPVVPAFGVVEYAVQITPFNPGSGL